MTKKSKLISLIIMSLVLIGCGQQQAQQSEDVQKAAEQKTTDQEVALFDMQEISQHNTDKDCWLLIDGKVYDATEFVARHPGGKSIVAGQIRNISLGGVFIAMEEPPAFGADLDLEFSIPTGDQNIRCKGFVVWSTKSNPEKAPGLQGMGVRLTDISVQEMRMLSEFIKTRLEE